MCSREFTLAWGGEVGIISTPPENNEEIAVSFRVLTGARGPLAGQVLTKQALQDGGLPHKVYTDPFQAKQPLVPQQGRSESSGRE